MGDFLKNIFMPQEDTSPAGSLDMTDLQKVVRNALIVGAGAVLTYLAQWVTSSDFGAYNGIVVPVVAGLIDIARKWLVSNNPEVK